MQLDLFDTGKNEAANFGKGPLIQIKGLSYIPDFISDKEHNEIWEAINKENWLTDLKRRVQHYGYKYDYKKRSLDYSMYIGSIPQWTNFVAERIIAKGYFKKLPDQVIVNEYLPGQGIADHIDCEPCFEDTIISLSLGSPCIMDFRNKNNKRDKHQLLLEPKSLVVITDDARYNWTHGIPSREKDNWLGKIIFRKTRISLTFRKVILGK
jgi:alkylated DNA repair dioxygenase AlkB